MSLPALLRLALEEETRPPEEVETNVIFVAAVDPESRELVVGVLAYVVEDVEPRFGVKLSLDFLGVLS